MLYLLSSLPNRSRLKGCEVTHEYTHTDTDTQTHTQTHTQSVLVAQGSGEGQRGWMRTQGDGFACHLSEPVTAV